MSRHRIICGLLIVLTLAVYAQVGGFGFIHLDDYDYVCENPHVHTGLNASNVAWAFTEAHSANWHSLTWLSLMADAQITRWIGGDPTTDAAVFHLTNLLLHLANVLLVFTALNLMTRAPWRSGIVAALFAVHPIHVDKFPLGRRVMHTFRNGRQNRIVLWDDVRAVLPLYLLRKIASQIVRSIACFAKRDRAEAVSELLEASRSIGYLCARWSSGYRKRVAACSGKTADQTA